MSYYITFSGATSASKGIEIVRRPDIPAPEPVYDPYIIPGRDGALMPTDITYGPLEIDVEMNFMSSTPETWGEIFRRAKKWLSGSGELSFSDDGTFFYKVYRASILESERTSRRIGTFTAHFYCDPYNYLASGKQEQSLGSGGQLQNQYELSHPIYTCIVTGSANLTANGNIFSIPRSAVIDTDKMLVTDYQNGDIMNGECTGDFEGLYLAPGTNTLALTRATSLKVTPNWRAL